MESKLAALEVEVENLKDWADKHERNDERTHKYMPNMMEDGLSKLASLERSATRFEIDLAHRNGTDLNTHQSLGEIFKRLRTLERMAWIAIGSTTAFGVLVTYFGKGIISLLNR